MFYEDRNNLYMVLPFHIIFKLKHIFHLILCLFHFTQTQTCPLFDHFRQEKFV